MSIIRIVCIGDIVGATGQAMLKKHMASLRKQADMIVINGENSTDKGRGLSPQNVDFYKSIGVDVITSGNHIWQKKEILHVLSERSDVLRPANYPPGVPGKGVTLVPINGHPVAIINLQGRVFMKEHVDCPFRALDSLITYLRDKTRVIIVDFHAEATSEKIGLATDFQGKITAVVGTHTHVQTADERILPLGTAFISDLGMTGSLYSMLGMQSEAIIQSLRTQLPTKFQVAVEPPYVLSGVLIEADSASGRAINITRIRIVDHEALDIIPSRD